MGVSEGGCTPQKLKRFLIFESGFVQFGEYYETNFSKIPKVFILKRCMHWAFYEHQQNMGVGGLSTQSPFPRSNIGIFVDDSCKLALLMGSIMDLLPVYFTIGWVNIAFPLFKQPNFNLNFWWNFIKYEVQFSGSFQLKSCQKGHKKLFQKRKKEKTNKQAKMGGGQIFRVGMTVRWGGGLLVDFEAEGGAEVVNKKKRRKRAF